MQFETDEQTLVFNKAWHDLLEEIAFTFQKKPDLQTLLFLIGVQELGQLHRTFNKEEKQDLMHLAVCKLLSTQGYFKYLGRDEEGWPHYSPTKLLPEDKRGLVSQEQLLKQQILLYFGKTSSQVVAN